MEKQVLDDGCAFAGLSGRPASEIPLDSPSPNFAPLEEGAFYRVEFANSDDPRDGSEFVTMLHLHGYWISEGDAGYVEGPLTVREADYKFVGRVGYCVASKAPDPTALAPV